MSEIGIDIGRYRGVSVADLQALGPIHAVRAIASRSWDGSDLFAEIHGAGLRLWLVFAHESFDSFGSWSEGFDYYEQLYGESVAVYQVGNEPDIRSPSSWTMDQNTFSELLFTARDRLGSDRYICAGGLASGIPSGFTRPT